MTKKFKVKTTAVIDRHPVGSTIELDEATAKALAEKYYVTIIGEATKPKAKKTTKKKTEDK